MSRPPVVAADERLATLANLVRALEAVDSIDVAARLCLRAIREATAVSSGRFEFTKHAAPSSQPAFVVHDPEEPAATVARRDRVVTIDVGGAGTATLTLHSDPARDGDRAGDVVIDVARALLGRIVERSHALEEHRKAEAARARKWRLLKQSEDALRARYARLRTAINNMSQGLAMYDDAGKIVLCNDLYASMYGLTSTDVRPGTSLGQIAGRRRAKGFDITDAVEDGAFETQGAPALKNESCTWRLLDGRRILVSVQPLWNGGWVTTHEDTTERERFEERISHLAHHDALTDLANRVLFRARLDRALAALNTGVGSLAVLWLDLDKFKLVNDTLGHIIGDQVLKTVAERLRNCVRDSDIVARLGGDEFAILQVSAKSVSHVEKLAMRVREVMATPMLIQGHTIHLDASIGISMAPGDTSDADQLLLNADTALYRAKGEGRGTHRFFKPGLDAAGGGERPC